MRQQLSSAERIRRRADFKQTFDRGVRLAGRLMTVFVLPNQLPVSRLGIAAGRRLGGAVQRNRAKRLIRETFRRNKPAPGFDLVIVPRRELLEASFVALESEYRALLKRRRPGAGDRA